LRCSGGWVKGGGGSRGGGKQERERERNMGAMEKQDERKEQIRKI